MACLLVSSKALSTTSRQQQMQHLRKPLLTACNLEIPGRSCVMLWMRCTLGIKSRLPLNRQGSPSSSRVVCVMHTLCVSVREIPCMPCVSLVCAAHHLHLVCLHCCVEVACPCCLMCLDIKGLELQVLQQSTAAAAAGEPISAIIGFRRTQRGLQIMASHQD